MSTSLAFNLSLLWILVLFGATLVNYYKNDEKLFKSGVYVLFIYASTHMIGTLWLASLPLKEVLSFHYILFAGIQLVLAFGLFWINKEKPRVMITITIVLLVIESLMGYGVHVDRNILALNGAMEPNTLGASKWWLWDALSYVSFANTFTVFLAITLPRIYQVKTDDVGEAYNIQTNVEGYVAKFKPSPKIEMTQAFLDVSGENLCFFDGVESQKNKNTAKVGLLLLNEAIKSCCYELHRTKPVNLFGLFVYCLRS